jgi:hypothetical protein
MKIYAGNLSYDLTDEKLREAFESFGEVTSAKVIKDHYNGQSRGFGFVEMAQETQAQAAIASLNGKELMGKQMTVNESRSRTGQGRSKKQGGRTDLSCERHQNDRLTKAIPKRGDDMDSNEPNAIFLKALATILIRSFLFGLAFLLLWFIVYLIAPGWMFQMSTRWFNISQRNVELINYYGMGFVKITILLLFLIPYLAIRSILRNKKRKD